MKEYKNKTRQEICNNLGKVKTSGDLKMLKSIVDLLIRLNRICDGVEPGMTTGQTPGEFYRYIIIDKVLSGDYNGEDLSHVSSFMTGIARARDRKAAS